MLNVILLASTLSVSFYEPPARQSLDCSFYEPVAVVEAAEPYMPTYRSRWNWPGDTEASLRSHLKTHPNHGLSAESIDRMTFAELRAVHSADHEGTLDRSRIGNVAARTEQVPTVAPQATVSRCPGGVCPTNQSFGNVWRNRPRLIGRRR